MHLDEKMISTDTVYEGRIFTITHDMVTLEDGSQADRDVLHHSGGVCVVPVTEDGQVYLVKQFRYPHSAVTTEIPAGKLEKGEDIAECGRRELLEEIGCTCEEYTYLGAVLPTPAYDTEVIHIYMAQGLKKAQQHLDEGEFLDVEKVPLTEAVEMVMDGRITDAKTQIGLLKAARLLEKK
ncbi:MAG TPA: NUDIX hydrolase [Ruminococcus sp.]|nr:NUDIX hydrolase [Ruminococcus sp.]